jgi:hypothetical protein
MYRDQQLAKLNLASRPSMPLPKLIYQSPSNPSTPNSRPSPCIDQTFCALLYERVKEMTSVSWRAGLTMGGEVCGLRRLMRWEEGWGHLLHPLVKQSTEGLVDATEKLDLASDLDSRQTEARDAAVEVTVNGRLGLVAIGV